MYSRICGLLRAQRLESPDEERSFMKLHQKWMPLCAVVVLASATLVRGVAFARILVMEQTGVDVPFKWEVEDPRFLTICWRAFSLAISLIGLQCILVAQYRRIDNVARIAELIVVVFSICRSIADAVTSVWRGPMLVGADPRDAWRGIEEVEAAELVTMVDVIQHIVVLSVLPIRCPTLLVHHLVVVVGNVVVRSSIRGPFLSLDTVMSLVVVTIAALAFSNSYRIEMVTRQCWLAMRVSQDAAEGSQLELEKQQATTDALRSVFRVLFDVVLQTNEHFSLTGDHSHVRDVLGEARGSSSTGVRLLDFFSTVDRDRFAKLASDASNFSVPQLMSTASTKSPGELVRQAEVLIADTKLEGDHKYLIGLRIPPLPMDNAADTLPTDFRAAAIMSLIQGRNVEVQARERRCMQTDLANTRREGIIRAAMQNASPAGMRNASSAGPIETDSSTGTSDCNVSRQWVPVEIRGNDHSETEVFAVIDSTATDCPIEYCNGAFASLCGPGAVGQGFESWVRDPEKFRSWLEHEANALLGFGHEISSGRQITLRPPALVARGFEIRVCLKLAPESVEPERILLRVYLHRVRWRTIEDYEASPKVFAL